MEKFIRNFCIIAHIDHGKSTLADRMLEITNTVEKRKMKEQVLDTMELERERGITIKMQPVRMIYWKPKDEKELDSNLPRSFKDEQKGQKYILNLIDTPGHVDFYYEVSRSLKAVEGAILLIDSTRGIQAQTLSTLNMAKGAGIKIIPALSKVDSSLARISEIKKDVANLLGVKEEEVLECSGKTGSGVGNLLEAVINRIPPPQMDNKSSNKFKALVFDFTYSNHRGVIVYVRIFSGSISKNKKLILRVTQKKFNALEVGVFLPEEKAVLSLSSGEIGYIVTGIKSPGVARIGDTITEEGSDIPTLSGYMKPVAVVWASVYPDSQDNFDVLRQAIERLRLSDSSFSFEEESSGILGRGFRCGFLGMLHLEIITERLRREFSLKLIVTTPTISYEVEDKKGKKTMIYSPSLFPEYGNIKKVMEPWAKVVLITPPDYIGPINQVLYEHEAKVGETETMSNQTKINFDMPLRELMRNFFDKIKSVSSGFASMSYQISDMREADVVGMDILVAEEIVPAFARIVARKRVETEAINAVEKLHQILPKQLFATKIQAKALGRIISSRTLSALRKDVTGYLYGGDVTRKMKLLEKQKKGKKKMRARGKVNIPHDVFMKMIQSN